MRAPTHPKKPARRAAARRAAASDVERRSALVDLVRAFLDRGERDRPTPSFIHLVGRLAPFCLRVLALVIIVGGGAGALVAAQLVWLVVLLVVLAAIDQWIVAPRVRGKETSLADRRGRPRSSPKPPPTTQADQPSPVGHPAPRR